jgi:hypothetical protein
MVTFDWLCQSCGNVDEHMVNYEDRDKPMFCTKCGKRTHRTWLRAPAVRGDQLDWSNMNKGKGMWNRQTNMYHKNRASVVEEAKKRNWDYSFG